MTSIIRSILEQDLYKFNMCANILRHHPRIPVEFRFNNRRPEGKFNDLFASQLNEQIGLMGELRTTDDEINFLSNRCTYLPPQVLEYIRNYRYNPKQIEFSVKDGELNLSAKGDWESVMMWEVPLMALISELYFTYCDERWRVGDWATDYMNRTKEKAAILKNCVLSEFGLRRRHSYDVQDLVVRTLIESHPNFVGVSNVHMAHKYNIAPIGTMAHELFMGYSVLKSLRHANRYVLQDWVDTFRGNVGIALTDTFGTGAFFGDFDSYFARVFDGVRHDSADPYEFGYKVIDHYNKLRIDPMGKTIVFSDGLTSKLSSEIEENFRGKIKTAFGIGTHLTNDFAQCKALNMVIKMWSCNGVPVVKLSDTAGKQIGDRDALRVANWIFRGTPLDQGA